MKTFLSVVSVVACLVGSVALFLPSVFLESKGVSAQAATVVWMRETGVLILCQGITTWLFRARPRDASMRAFLLGSAAVQLGLLPIEIIAFAEGTITRLSGILPNSLLHVVLGTSFVVLALRTPVPDAAPLVSER